MKTEDLIEALNLVSQDYIMETRPEPAQHCESRKQKCDAAGVTKQTTFSRSNAAPGKDHTLKTNTITHTHRIMKGLAAVAACAVFICGGWMILKLKDQQQIGMVDASVSESNSDSLTERIEEIPQGEPNFLGGQGEIHVLGSQSFMYDDTRFYFDGGVCYAERTDSELTEYHSMPAKTTQFLSKLFYDGNRFYYAKEHSLYPVATDGTISEAPFFTLTDDMLPYGLSVSSFGFDNNCISVYKMTDDAVLIQIAGNQSTDFCCIQAVCHTDGTVNLLTGNNRYGYIANAEDGSIFAESWNSDGEGIVITRIGTDGSEKAYTRFSGAMNYVRYMAQHGDKLYILLNTGPDDHPTLEYSVLDLNEPHEVSNLQCFSESDAQWIKYAFSNGQQDFVVKTEQKESGAVLYGTDTSWENQQELIRASDFGSEGVFLADADENYVILALYESQYAVYDLRSGSTQLFRADGTTDGDTGETETLHVDESLYCELDPGFTGINFLGGQGSLHIPKSGSQILWYDDTYFYFPAGCFPRYNNIMTSFPAKTGLAEDYEMGRIISSGDRLFIMKDGVVNLIDSSGGLTPFLRLADAGLTGDAHFISHISRIGDYILFPCRGTYSGMDSCAYIWTDTDGNILEIKSGLPSNTEFIECKSDDPDDDSSAGYYMAPDTGNQIHRIALPGSDEAQTDFTLPGYSPNMEPQHLFVRAYGDKIFYFDQDGNYCAFEPDTGEKSVILEADTHATGFELDLPVINGKLYYTLTDPFSEEPLQTDIMQIDLNTGETQKLLSFDQSYINSVPHLSVFSNQLYLQTSAKFVLYNPETDALFRLT
ncbi:MAG: hypothetical protein K5705_07745 [Oscillospiraceae bacterium]|nr:hypothetical protein [Oscillospiraceae bacterium]